MLKRFLKYFLSASFIGIIIGLVGLYYELRERQTHLTADVVAETNVLDVVHPIPDLAILFQGQDIEKQRANLKVLSVRLINDGQTNIHEDDFDSRMPFGLQIDGGLVVRAQVTGASSSYLGENLHPRLSGQSQIAFDKIIFDKGSSVTVEALVIHDKEKQPRVIALGKIAGLDRIVVTNSFQAHEQQSFWGGIFQGPPAVQILRLISYSFGGLVSVLAIGFLIFGAVSSASRWQKWRRRKKAAGLPQAADPEKAKVRKAIEEIYIEHGVVGLRQAREQVTHQDLLKGMLEARRDLIRMNRRRLSGPSRSSSAVIPPHFIFEEMGMTQATIQPFRRAGLVRLEKDVLTVHPDLARMIQDFIEQVS